MQVGDHIEAVHEGMRGVGIVMALRVDRAYVQLTVRPVQAWTSRITGGVVPAGCPLTYCLWLPSSRKGEA